MTYSPEDFVDSAFDISKKYFTYINRKDLIDDGIYYSYLGVIKAVKTFDVKFGKTYRRTGRPPISL